MLISDIIYRMPATHQRMAAREEEAALTATIATPEFTFADDDNIAKEIEDAYEEFKLQQAIGDTDMDAIEAIITASAETPSTPFELTLLCDKIAYSLRPNPRARAMTRKGRRYCIRKDHGTKVFYREVAEANAAQNSRQLNSRAALRKEAKLTDRSGNPRVIDKLKKLGDLLVD